MCSSDACSGEDNLQVVYFLSDFHIIAQHYSSLVPSLGPRPGLVVHYIISSLVVPSNGVRLVEFDILLQIYLVVETLFF